MRWSKTVPAEDHKLDEFGDVPENDQSSDAPGEFTRVFGGKTDPTSKLDPSVEDTQDDLSPAPGSLTQLLAGKSKTPSPPPPDKLNQPPLAVPNPPDSRPASSFTMAFDGVNAFTRNPADLGEYHSPAEAGQETRPDLTPSESAGSFTRLFGSGEGILTPAGEEERPRPSPIRDPRPLAPSRPPAVASGSFTEAFRPQSAPKPHEPSVQPGSFTEEFGPPASWPTPEPLPPSKSAPTYPSRPGGAAPGYNSEPLLPSNPQRPSTPAGGFTRLIDPLRPEPAPPPEPTLPSMRSARIPDRPLPDLNYTPSRPASEGSATVVFNPSRQPEPEVTAPQGKSEYTMVVERSKLRPPGPGTGGSPYGAGTSAAPPNPPQYPQFAPPPAPTWTPPPAPAPPWQPPQLTPPAMPQAPALAAPALPVRPPTLGDQLVSFLPFMLALTVINFLGLLAVLIILFATRK